MQCPACIAADTARRTNARNWPIILRKIIPGVLFANKQVLDFMATETIIFTVFAPDRPGIVKTLSDTVLAHGGNWLESSLTRLCGQFAGIVHIRVPAEKKSKLIEALAKTANGGIQVTVHANPTFTEKEPKNKIVRLTVEANDREGIVDEIASALASNQVNVEKFTSSCASASMAGYDIFTANIKVALPENLSGQDLEAILENVSDDLMVSVKDD